MANTKAEILAFRRHMKTLAGNLHKKQLAEKRSREEPTRGAGGGARGKDASPATGLPSRAVATPARSEGTVHAPAPPIK